MVIADCPLSLGVLTLNALAAASHLVVVTEPSFLALQGIEELLETRALVRAHYNAELVIAGVVVNRVERTVEHHAGLAEIASYFRIENGLLAGLAQANGVASRSASRPNRRIRSGAVPSTRMRSSACLTSAATEIRPRS